MTHKIAVVGSQPEQGIAEMIRSISVYGRTPCSPSTLEIKDDHFGVQHSTGAIMALLLSLDGDNKQYQCEVLRSVMNTHGITTAHLDLIAEQPDVINEAAHADWQRQWDRLENADPLQDDEAPKL